MNKVSRMFTPIIAMGATVLCLMACEKMDLPEEKGTNEENVNSVLQVRTRTASENDEYRVSYPINIYVFKGEKCVALQTLTDENHPLSIALTEGDYSVYAIGGASAENYLLPSQEDATPSMAISLQAGKRHDDLMVAKSNVTLVDGGTNTLTLALERKVMMLQNVTLNKIPSAATAVSVTISPLWQRLEGTTYAGKEGSTTIALSKQTDGHTWTFTGEEYLLPPSGNLLTITVNIVTPNSTSTYSYNVSEQLEASSIFNIQGTYTEAIGVTLTGTITGSKWKSEKTISFEFDETANSQGNTGNKDNEDNGNNNDDNGEEVSSETIPTVGSTYKDCLVLAVNEVNGITEVLLLSPTQEKKVNLTDKDDQESVRKKINKIMPSYSIEGNSGWRLMTKAEAEILHSLSKTIPDFYKDWNIYSTYGYLIDDEGVVKTVKMGSETFLPSSKFSSTDVLRPVTIIKIKNL